MPCCLSTLALVDIKGVDLVAFVSEIDGHGKTHISKPNETYSSESEAGSGYKLHYI